MEAPQVTVTSAVAVEFHMVGLAPRKNFASVENTHPSTNNVDCGWSWAHIACGGDSASGQQRNKSRLQSCTARLCMRYAQTKKYGAIADDVFATKERKIRSYPVALPGRLGIAARYVLVHVSAVSSELAANYNPDWGKRLGIIVSAMQQDGCRRQQLLRCIV